ncbi:MAG: glycosyltransferase family 4 protein [Xanthobacteraceae bacterium]
MTDVLVLTRYERLGASSRIRFLQFLPALERQGFSFDVRPLLDNAYVASLYGGPKVGAGSIIHAYWRRLSALRRRLRYDLIWLEKEALPWLPTWMEIARLEGIPYVVDYDDAWFHRYENHWLRPLLGHKIDAVMRVAHTVVAGNDYLARRARQAGARHVEIVPTAIDLDRYVDLPQRSPGRALTVGWIGIPLNAHYLAMIEPALRAVSAIGPVELQVVGAPVPPAFAGISATSFPWMEDTETSRIAQFDVGVMPLHDTPWERGKCAYKLLQVMAAGKPVIASPVGVNRQVVRNGVNGFLAETTEEWAEALRQLADPALRQRMGAEARKTVEEQYSTAIVVPRLAEILNKAAQF